MDTAESHRWIAEQQFRCVGPDGRSFELAVCLGQPIVIAPDEVGRYGHSKCRLALEPLAKDRWIAAGNAFQAICLALEHVRTVFKVFLAEGGRIYWEDTDSPVDVGSPWLAPLPSPAELSLVTVRENDV